MSDIVGGKLCSKTGGGKLETATKNQRKMAPESRLNQHEKCWRAPAFVERSRPAENKTVSDKVGAELCSKTGGGNLETATKLRFLP